MTDEELQELKDCVYDYALAYKISWEKTQDEWEQLVNFVNGMLAEREKK